MEHKNTSNQNLSPQNNREVRPYYRMSRKNAYGKLIWNRRTPFYDKICKENGVNKSDGVKRSQTKIDGSNEAGSSKGKKIMKVSDKKKLMRGSSGKTPLPDKKELSHFLDELKVSDSRGEFSAPVDADRYPEYYEVIKKPMDFGKMTEKLDRGAYKNLQQFEADVFLVCSNALQYYQDEVFRTQAAKIRKYASNFFATLKGVPTDHQSPPPPPPIVRPPPPLPAASGNNKRKRTTTTETTTTGRVGGSSSATAAFNWNDEFPEYVLKLDRKAGNNKEFVVDMNKRHTYNKSMTTSSPPLEQEVKQLVTAGLDEPLSYARSLARFAADLGPVAWKIASKKIEAALPPGAQYGPGWVTEPATADEPVQQAAADQDVPSDSNARGAREFPVGYFTDLLASPESDKYHELAEMGPKPPKAASQVKKKKITPSDRNNAAKKPLKKAPSNLGTSTGTVASRLVPSGYYDAGNPKMKMPLNLGAGCYYTAGMPSNVTKPAENHGLSPEMIEAVRKLNSQNAAVVTAASSWRRPISNKQQSNPSTHGGNALLFQNQGSRVTDMGGFNATVFNYSPALMKQDWASKEPADFSFARNNNFCTGSSSTGAGVNVTKPNYVSVQNQQPVTLQTWEKNSNAWGFAAGSSAGGVNLHNPNNIPVLNQQPAAVPQNWEKNNNARGFSAGSSAGGINLHNPNNTPVLNQQPAAVPQNWEKNNNAWGFSAGSSAGGINLHNPNNIPILSQQPAAVPQNWEINNNAWGFSAGSSTGGNNLRNPNNIPILHQQPGAVPQNWANNAWGFAAGSSSSAGQAMPNPSFAGNLPMRMAPVNNVPASSGVPFVDLTGEKEDPELSLQL